MLPVDEQTGRAEFVGLLTAKLGVQNNDTFLRKQKKLQKTTTSSKEIIYRQS